MNILKRLWTAAVLLALAYLVILYSPQIVFSGIIQLFIFAALFEFYRLAEKKHLFPQKIFGLLTAFAIGLSFHFEFISLPMVMFACFLGAAVYFLIVFRTIEKLDRFPSSVAVTFFGAVYLGTTFNHFLPLRDEFGPYPILFTLSVVFIADTGAFLFGKLFGRHKMTPVASPHKTWEGCIGGVVFAVISAVVAFYIFPLEFPLWKAVLFGVLLNAVSQVSDPFESLFKRAVNVKDSSNLLPGHGGFLDRIDSLILAIPVFYYLMKFFG